MYNAFYGLNESPFGNSPDPRFIYWSETYRHAYTMLEYGLSVGGAITVITGDIGCGKTTLIRRLLEDQDESATFGVLSNTPTQIDNVLSWVLYAFGQRFDGSSKVELFHAFQQYLIDQHHVGKRVVLVVDEAQNMDMAALEELRMLTNINTGEDLVFQLILSGHQQLRYTLMRPEMTQLAQRVAADFNLGPLDPGDTNAYIASRLSAAGRTRPLFEAGAVDKIYEFSEGVPRVINTICDLCLVYGFAAEATSISENLVDKVLADKEQHNSLGKRDPAVFTEVEEHEWELFEDSSNVQRLDWKR